MTFKSKQLVTCYMGTEASLPLPLPVHGHGSLRNSGEHTEWDTMCFRTYACPVAAESSLDKRCELETQTNDVLRFGTMTQQHAAPH